MGEEAFDVTAGFPVAAAVEPEGPAGLERWAVVGGEPDHRVRARLRAAQSAFSSSERACAFAPTVYTDHSQERFP